jgi:pimeloyl-ACP methyl ester carboxylesterase
MAEPVIKPATFVLVHGAWHGGWCWKKLRPLLRSAGHRVFSPSLTGLGERSHLLSPEIDLETHIRDVIAVIEYEDLDNVVLVGHSYGGMVITGVADRIGARLAQQVYLDAFVPNDGESLNDMVDGFMQFSMREDGWRVAPPCPVQAWGLTDEADIAWAQARIGDHPLRCFTQPLRLAGQARTPSRGAFVQTGDYSGWPPGLIWIERAEQRGLEHRTLDFSAGHDAMITQPRELAEILLDLV